jgi:hypothetical protein
MSEWQQETAAYFLFLSLFTRELKNPEKIELSNIYFRVHLHPILLSSGCSRLPAAASTFSTAAQRIKSA